MIELGNHCLIITEITDSCNDHQRVSPSVLASNESKTILHDETGGMWVLLKDTCSRVNDIHPLSNFPDKYRS